jgi:hypothetical protein
MKPDESKNEREQRRRQDEKVDEAIRETFPASDPAATGKATSTVTPKRSADHRPPVISAEEIEQARKGKGHTQNDSIKRTK